MATEKKPLPENLLVTPECRLSFPSLFTPKPRARGSEKLTYQATLLLPPGFDKAPFAAAVKAAMMKKWNKIVALGVGKNPLRDAAEKDYAGYEPGWVYISTNSDRKPSVVDRSNQPVTDPERAYPGMWVRAYLDCFAWDHPTGGKGVSFGLLGIQLLRDGERLDGRRPAADVFEALEPLPMDPGESTGGDDPLALPF